MNVKDIVKKYELELIDLAINLNKELTPFGVSLEEARISTIKLGSMSGDTSRVLDRPVISIDAG